MSNKDDIDDEIEEELKKEREQAEKQKYSQKKADKNLEEDKLAKIREEKARLQSIMEQRQTGKSPEKVSKQISPKEEKVKKQKTKEVKSPDEITDKEKKIAILKNKFSWENIQRTLKEKLTPDNILKYKAFIIIIMMLAVPALVYIASVESKVNQLVEEQSPKITHLSSQYSEVLFEIDMRNPMARDNNNSIYRSFGYKISFSQDPDTFYLLPLDQYYMHVHDLTFKFSFKNSTPYAPWVSNVYSVTLPFDEELLIGESLSGNQPIPLGIFGDFLPSSQNWTYFSVLFKVNATFYYDPGVPQEIALSFQGTVVDIGQLKTLNISEAQDYALMVTVIYLFIAGFATVTFILYLRKKKYSYIKPY